MSVMDTSRRHITLSFEVFPPRTEAGMEALCGKDGVLRQLYTLRPGYISCTYSPGGVNAGKNLDVLDRVRADGICTPVTHFTCLGNTAQSAKAQLQTYLDHGICHILALRGDTPPGFSGTGSGLGTAAELVALIQREFGSQFTIAVAGAPEGHSDCQSLEAEIDSLKRKQDSGAARILTRPCWDMDTFRYWLDAIRASGIHLPVEAGVLPVTDQAETVNAVLARSGGVMPSSLCALLRENWILPNPFVKDPFDADVERKRADFRKAGIEYTVNQINEYQACGVDGIHLFTQNRFADMDLIVRQSGLTDNPA